MHRRPIRCRNYEMQDSSVKTSGRTRFGDDGERERRSRVSRWRGVRMTGVPYQSASSTDASRAGESKTRSHDNGLSAFISVHPRLFRICDMAVSGGDPPSDS